MSTRVAAECNDPSKLGACAAAQLPKHPAHWLPGSVHPHLPWVYAQSPLVAEEVSSDFIPSAVQMLNHLSPMCVTCPMPSSQPSVMQSICALKCPVGYFSHASANWFAILIYDFRLSVRRVVVLCLNESTQHRIQSFLLHERNVIPSFESH